MGIYLVLVGYSAIAMGTAGYVFYQGAMGWHGRPVVFGAPEMAKLSLACLMVGATWVLFVPGLIAITAREHGVGLEVDPRDWLTRWQRSAGSPVSPAVPGNDFNG